MGRFRDAITGFFTTKAHAKAHPHTTVRETRTAPARVEGEVTILLPDGKVGWRIHADGRIDGFPHGCAVINGLHVKR